VPESAAAAHCPAQSAAGTCRWEACSLPPHPGMAAGLHEGNIQLIPAQLTPASPCRKGKVGLCCCGACSLPPCPSKAADLLEHSRRRVNVAMVRVLPESCRSRIGICRTSCRAQPSSSEGRHASKCWARGNARIARQLVRCQGFGVCAVAAWQLPVVGSFGGRFPTLRRASAANNAHSALFTMQGSRPH